MSGEVSNINLFIDISRYAACLPVVALRDEYHPAKEWDASMAVDDELKGIVIFLLKHFWLI